MEQLQQYRTALDALQFLCTMDGFWSESEKLILFRFVDRVYRSYCVRLHLICESNNESQVNNEGVEPCGACNVSD